MTTSSILTKSAKILDIVCEKTTPMSFTEIVDVTGLPKSSVHRLLAILKTERLLEYDQDRQTYTPGRRMLTWGVKSIRVQNLATIAASEMEKLCKQIGFQVALSVLDGDMVVYLQTAENKNVFRLAPKIGECSPIHASAAGKLLLSALPDERISKFIKTAPFEQCTEFTKTNENALIAEIKAIRAQRYAICDREEFRQISGIAIAIKDYTNQPIAALSIWDANTENLLEGLKQKLPQAFLSAKIISTKLGYLDEVT